MTAGRTKSLSIALLVGAALVGVAPEADARRAEDEFGRTGPYFGIGASYGQYVFAACEIEKEFTEAGFPGAVDVAPQGGINARLGWRLHANLAAELALEYFPSTDVRRDGERDATIEGGALAFNMKAYFLTGRIQPFAQIGFGILRGRFETVDIDGVDINDADQGIVGRFGAGVDVYINPHIAVSTDVAYLAPSGSIEDLGQVTVGVGLLFRY